MSLDYASLLGDEAESLLNHKAVVPSSSLHLPGPDHFDSVWGPSDRSPQVLRSLQALHGHGRLANTGYLSILPVDQGIEHAAGASFAKNPEYFDGENIVKLAIEGGCNAVATTFGALSGLSRKYAHRIPFIVKINHNELLTMPNQFDQANALVGKPDEGRAKTLARCQHRVLDGCGQFWLTTSFSQCPRQEGIACVTMCLEYGRHTAIVGCNRD